MDAAPVQLPSALGQLALFRKRLRSKKAVVFLDYDGTLTPIVSRPELAQISPEMKGIVGALSERCPVAVVSGRARTTVKEFVRLDNVIYAGSHGLEIAGPPSAGLRLKVGEEFRKELEMVYRGLSAALSDIPGVLVQQSGYTVPVHYRLVHPSQIPVVERIVSEELRDHPNIRRSRGKMVFEIRPDIAWDKGKAVEWIRERLGLSSDNAIAFYVGDDTTDEDAFSALHDGDVGILVAETPRETKARYLLKDPSEVGQFLQGLIDIINWAEDERQI